ncbi:RNA polymerase sigma factor, sigma-70 family [Catalinimonas alkaloidigena]|uniref:RNA polymerase sigma factor, sigma-70 family n=1 Tax=Catalinimonas alkaloidigena TaxID=1075417 RepID=A0A1G9KYM6_9BACT|nr:sigma-70 family RNA polymerase sigma factor [Catalinimonas alkaloidigena]SDL54696.1 RNA polymerase sigma factor, sigma-70 family [Catalinimonas alkaloidigena]
MSTASPEALWMTFLAGDEVAFTSLYRAFYRDLFKYGCRLLHDDDQAQNLIHELFLDLWDKRAQLSSVHSVRAYLLVAYRHRILRFLDTARRYPLKSLNEVTALPQLGFTFSPEDFLIDEEHDQAKKERLVQAINQLTDRQREIIYLRYYRDLSLPEIAEALSINYQSVANHLQRAFAVLRQDKALRIALELSSLALPLLWWFLH